MQDTSLPIREPAAFPQLSLRARWCSSWQAGVLLALIGLCTLLPGLFTLPPIDRDEARFAQASRQMLESGNYIVPKVQDRPRLNKPPLIYWLQSTSTRVCLALQGSAGDTGRDAIWMYRLPSAFAALCSVLLTWRLGLRMLDSRAAFIGAAGLSLSPLLIVDAHQARADQVLVALTIAAMLALWRVLHEPRGKSAAQRVDAGRVAMMSSEAKKALAAQAGLAAKPTSTLRPAWWALWLLVGIGILAKGPITPLVVVLAVLAHCALQRSWQAWKLARPGLGMLVALACVLPWVLLVMQQVGVRTYFAIIFDETIGRSMDAKEGHWGPPGYHLLLLTPLLFPITLTAGAAIVAAVRSGMQKESDTDSEQQNEKRRARFFNWKSWQSDRASLFLLCWLLPAWIVFELVSTKLPHYPLPTYAAIALLAARGALSMTGLRPQGWARVGCIAWTLVGIAGLGAACIALAHWLDLPPLVRTLGYVAGSIAILLLLAAGIFSLQGRLLRGLLLAGLATALALGTVLGVLLPHAQGERNPWIARDAATVLLRIERETRTRIAAEEAAKARLEAEAKAAARAARKQESEQQTHAGTQPLSQPLPLAEDEATPDLRPAADPVPIACCDFKEDSLIFLTHGRIARVEREAAQAWIAANPQGLLLTTKQVASTLTGIRTLHTLRGFNHPRFAFVDVVIVSKAEGP